jgi:4-hydroxybenzoate polyprenyltransferase/phosphoserine phosphatase
MDFVEDQHMDAAVAAVGTDRPLVVDLDGTLIKSDLLVESFFALLASAPLRGVAASSALYRGHAHLKARIADEAVIDLTSLPFNEELVAFLRAEKSRGRPLYLATAAHEKYANAMAAHLGLFDGVFASDGKINLKGAAKAELLCKTFGRGNFDYAGDGKVDLAIWEAAGGVMVVGASGRLIRMVQRRFPHATVLSPRTTGIKDYARALRLHQWLKNLLVFVPAFTAHHFDGATMIACLIAFLSFSFCASSVYLLNDLLDLRSDRDHPTKRRRPFASGQVDILHGVVLFPTILVLSLSIGLSLPWKFPLALAAYYILTLSYSVYLKRQVILDVVALATLYGMRLVGGAAAVSVTLSPWILTFAIFIFLSLALVKRWTELVERVNLGKGELKGRGYRLSDLPVLQTMATSSGYVAVLIFGLYINSPTVSALYSRPNVLWAIPLILLYWVSRIMILTHRGEMQDDPVLFATKDRVSLVCAVLMILVVMAGL